MLEVTSDDIEKVRDDDLRTLVGRLCEAELRQRGLPLTAITYGGDQNARDGGIDVRIDLPDAAVLGDFLPRAKVGPQVKKPAMSPSDILSEMRPHGVIRTSIVDLAQNSGGYIIVSSGANTSDTALIDRRQAMRDAVVGVANADALHVDFYDRSRLATWLRNHPAIIPWVREKVGRSIQGWRSYDAWAFSPDGLSDDYLNDDALRIRAGQRDGAGTSAADGIKRLRNMLSKPRGVVRLTGLSGVGKTRLAQALFDPRIGEDSLDPSLVIYTDMGDAPIPNPSHMAETLAAGNARIILLVDNCPSDLHRRLADICRRPGSSLSVLTIEYDIQEDEPEGTEVLHLEPSSDDLIQKLLRRRFPEISAIDAETIARFSGGNARSAIAVAETVGRNETVATLSDDALLCRLFQQRNAPDEKLMLAAQACAMVYSFDGETLETPRAELPQLSNLAGMTADELFTRVVTLKRRGLVQQRSIWRAVLPHVIANSLAKLALQNFPVHKIEAAMNTERLQRSFARRLGYLHDSAEARTLVARWLAPNGRLGFINSYEQVKWQMFEYIAPVSSAATLAWFDRMIGTTSENISLISWKHKSAADLLRLLAYESEHFKHCIDLLLVLAEAEAASKRLTHQSIGNTIEGLFKIIYSGTRAPVEVRASVVDELLRSTNSVHREIGVKALEELLRTRHFQSNSTFEFGARTRDFGFWPNDRAEIVHWYRVVLGLVEQLACSQYLAAPEIRSVFARSIEGLWTWEDLNDETKHLGEQLSVLGWQEGWIAIRKALRNLKQSISADSIKKLEELETLLHPNSIVDRIRAVVLTEAWGTLDYADVDEREDEEDTQTVARHERAAKIAQELGEEVAIDDAALTTILPELVSGGGSRVVPFGIGLATRSRERSKCWSAIVEAVRNTQAGRRNYGLHCGFISGVYKAEPLLCDALLDPLVGDPVLGPWLPLMQTCLPLDDAGTRRLCRMLETDTAPIENYRNLGYGRYRDQMRPEDFGIIIDAILKKPNGFLVACDILSMRLHSENKTENSNPQLAEIGRSILQKIEFDSSDNMQSYRLTQIAKVSLVGDAGKATANEVCKKIRKSIKKHLIYRFDNDKFLRTMFELQPIAALDALFGREQSERGAGYQLIKSTSLHFPNPLDGASNDVLIAWCNRSPRRRYQQMSRVVSYSRSAADGNLEWTPVALRMIEQAPDPTVVLSIFIERFSPTSWEGSRATYIEKRAMLLNALIGRFSSAIDEISQLKRLELQVEIDRQRDWEATRDRDRDESFE